MRWAAVAIVVIMATPPARADDANRESWAFFAGTHLGNAEGVATCKGMRINAARRDWIVKRYAEGDHLATFDATRAKAARRLSGLVKGQPRQCAAWLSLYGPSGVLIRGYVLPAGTTAGDVTYGIDLNPRPDVGAEDAFTMMVLERLGAAAAIEAACGPFEAVPGLDLMWRVAMAGEGLTAGEKLKLITLAMASFAKEHGLKEDRAEFCRRALNMHGPAGDVPMRSASSFMERPRLLRQCPMRFIMWIFRTAVQDGNCVFGHDLWTIIRHEKHRVRHDLLT